MKIIIKNFIYIYIYKQTSPIFKFKKQNFSVKLLENVLNVLPKSMLVYP